MVTKTQRISEEARIHELKATDRNVKLYNLCICNSFFFIIIVSE